MGLKSVFGRLFATVTNQVTPLWSADMLLADHSIVFREQREIREYLSEIQKGVARRLASPVLIYSTRGKKWNRKKEIG
jgi:hypothetical protein